MDDPEQVTARHAWRGVERLPALLIALSVCMLLAVGVLQMTDRLQAYVLMGDVRGMVELPIYAGWLSDAGILLWWSAASIAFFSGALCGWNALERGLRWTTESTIFLLGAGLVTAFLAIDDAWLLHERVWPALFGISQPIVYAVYAVVLLLCLVSARSAILAHPHGWLLAGFAWLGCSVALDLLPRDWRLGSGLHTVLEDGCKWLGILSWSLYLWLESLVRLRQSFTR